MDKICSSKLINKNSSPKTLTSKNVNLYKKSPNDFKFELLIGSGSFSMVMKAREIKTNNVYAIKACEKQYIRQEKMKEAIMREKNIMNILNDHPNPFFVKLYCTFQDEQRLYFVMNYAVNGELLSYINKVGSFDEKCTRFYSAQILLALEHLHSLNIIHRDLKPENILLNEKMHIQLTDFGSACILKNYLEKDNEPEENKNNQSYDSDNEEERLRLRNNSIDLDKPSTSKPKIWRKNSFVGTAQYISPEMLKNKKATRSSDLWALGCIIYQMIAGALAFKASNEYLIFQKVQNLDYKFPDGFNTIIKNLIENFLKLDPNERLGALDILINKETNQKLGYVSIRNHEFFKELENKWDTLHEMEAPRILPYLPKNSNSEELRSEFTEPGFNDKHMTRLLGLYLSDDRETFNHMKNKNICDISPSEYKQKFEAQKRDSIWHQFVDNNLILKQGIIDKRKGLFAKRRIFLLTTGPHLYYVDPVNSVLKGEIPWSQNLRPELKNFKTFFVHTPKRVFYLEEPNGKAPSWCKAIEDVRIYTYFRESLNKKE